MSHFVYSNYPGSSHFSVLLLLVIGHSSTDPGSVCDSPIASGPSESVHTTAGKRVLKTSTKIGTGPTDGMC